MPHRVLFLHSSAGRYGADNQLALIATGLDPARYRPVVVLAQDGPLRERLVAAGVEVHIRELAVLRRSDHGPVRLARRVGADVRALRSLGADLVHANTSVILAATALGLPSVVHVREIYAAFPRAWPAYRAVLRRADRLLAVSEAARAPLGAGEVVHDGLIPPPPLPDRTVARAELGLEAEAFVVALLGRISPWKGQDQLAQALAALPEATGVIAGDAWDPEHEESLRNLAAMLGVADRLRLLGFRPDIETVLAAADVVAVPSTLPDPLPNSALEATAAGCCVVASRLGGLPEILRDGETGVLFDPGDLVPALARVTDPAERARLGTAAAADVRDRFAPERLLSRVQAVYDELLA